MFYVAALPKGRSGATAANQVSEAAIDHSGQCGVDRFLAKLATEFERTVFLPGMAELATGTGRMVTPDDHAA